MLKNSKYNKILTVILVIVILGIIGLIVYMALDYYKKTQETSESDEILGQLDEYLNQEQGSNIGSLPGDRKSVV